MVRSDIVTSAEVLRTANYDDASEAGGADQVSDAIDQAQTEVGSDWGDPVKKTYFPVDSTQTKYEYWYNNRKVFRVDKVFIINDSNERTEYTSGTASEVNKEYTWSQTENAITFHSDSVSANTGLRIEVQFVWHDIYWLIRLKAALYLLDNASVNNAEENTPTTGLRIFQRVQRMEKAMQAYEVAGSENNKFYDPTLGERILQKRFYTY